MTRGNEWQHDSSHDKGESIFPIRSCRVCAHMSLSSSRVSEHTSLLCMRACVVSSQQRVIRAVCLRGKAQKGMVQSKIGSYGMSEEANSIMVRQPGQHEWGWSRLGSLRPCRRRSCSPHTMHNIPHAHDDRLLAWSVPNEIEHGTKEVPPCFRGLCVPWM